MISLINYIYHSVVNILTISENGKLRYSYTYDKLGQLLQANHYSDAYYADGYDDVYEYVYDKAGNIIFIGHHYGKGAVYSDVNTYTYGDATWGDLLTSYSGKAITYDAIGNPLKWRNANIIEWQGRQLTLFEHQNGSVITYEYNADGITAKTVYNVSGGVERITKKVIFCYNYRVKTKYSDKMRYKGER